MNTPRYILLIIIFLVVFYIAGYTQTDSQGTKKEGVVFKIPDDVFPIDLQKSGFKGILMLRKDAPSGSFVAYPNDSETIDALRQRLAIYVVPMFMHDKETAAKLTPQISVVPTHPGDVEMSGSYYLYGTDKTQVQVLFYQRIANGKPLLYGYFANKNIDSKDDVAIKGWADKNGQGVKIFESFWKTIKE